MALVRCILGKFLGLVCHCFPTFRCSHFRLHVHSDVRGPSSERWNYGRERLSSNFAYVASIHTANLRHGTNGFTSRLNEDMLRTFSPLKIRWLRPGLNPQTWVLKASTLPLDHRSRFWGGHIQRNSYRAHCVPGSAYVELKYSIIN